MQVASITLVHSLVSLNYLTAILEWLVGESKKPTESLMEYVNTQEHRRKLLRYVWLVAVLLTVLGTALILLFSKWLAGNLKPGLVVAVLTWAILIGGTALVSLSSKLLTALFGGLIGVSLSEVTTGFSGLLEKAIQGITLISTQIAKIAGTASSGYSDFIQWMVWMFVVVVALFCLPAFFSE